MEALSTFLGEHISKNKELCTHTSMLSPMGCYNIKSANDKKRFYNLYCKALNENAILGITEKPSKYTSTPLHIDIDFKFKLEDYKEELMPKIIEKIISLYQKSIQDIIDEKNFDSSYLNCILLQKSKKCSNDPGIINAGFHLHFPHFVSKWWVQDKVIRGKVVNYVIQSCLFHNLKLPENTTVENVFDPVATKTWLMYGSRKKRGFESYLVTKCFDSNLEPMSLEEIFEEELEDLDTIEGKNIEYYLPILLSLLDKEESVKLKKCILDMEPRFKNIRRRAIKKTKTNETILEELKFIEESELVDMLSTERATDRNKWIEVGWTLFCIGEGHEKALNMWLQFSQKCEDKYNEEICINEWNNMEVKGKTIATLKMMAQIDNPEKYARWRQMHIRSYYEEAISFGNPKKEYSVHYPLGKLLQTMYDNFVCADSKKNIWYKFYNHRWNLVDDGVDLKKLLTFEVKNAFLRYGSEIMSKTSQTFDETEREKLIKKSSIIQTIVHSLGKVQMVKNIVEAAKIYFHDVNFLKKLDENRSLIGMENGVYDLDAGIFREGRPDDYITYTTELYYWNYSNTSMEVKQLEMFLNKIFVDEELRNYTLDSICSCLKGGNQDKRFYILTGDGDNGKSVFINLVESTFGDYFWKFEQELLVRGNGNNSSSARPELANVKGRRLCVVDEIPVNKEIDIGILKKLTGNDSFFARLLHENGSIIKPMFTLFLQCNALPKIPSHDTPTWNRTRVIDCESSFVDNPPEEEAEQFRQKIFKKDTNMSEKLIEMSEPFIWYLFERYKKYRRNGSVEPKKVKISTQNYRSDNDIYLQFMTENLKVKKGNKILVTKIYSAFKDWYKDNYPEYYQKEQIGNREMVKELSQKNRLGKVHVDKKRERYWINYIFAEEDVSEPDYSDNEDNEYGKVIDNSITYE